MVKTLMIRGALAGGFAGVAALVVAVLFGEPGINRGILIEQESAAAVGVSAQIESVGRGVQSTFGLAFGTVLFGVVVGTIFALIYALLYGRLGRLTPRATSALLAAVGFVAIFLVPFLKYPANPPGATDGATIGQRTGLHLVMMSSSVLLAIAAAAVTRHLAPRIGSWNAATASVTGYVAAVWLIEYLMPVVDEIPGGFPAAVLYDFRLASLGGQLVLWSVLGLVFGALVDGRARRAGLRRSISRTPA